MATNTTAPDTIEKSATTALAPSPVAPPMFDRVPVRMGIVPTSLEEGWRLASMMAKSSLVPKNFRNQPEDVLVAIQMGVEIGFAPMQALQSIAVINGRPGVWGDGFLALIMNSPVYQDHDEYYEVDGQRRDGLVADDFKKDTTTAVCTFWRKGKGTPVTRRFTVAQAKKASLLGKEGPWQTYPDRMLAMRARGFAGRDTFPDILRGIHVAEELRDLPAELPEVAPRAVQRLSEMRSPNATGRPVDEGPQTTAAGVPTAVAPAAVVSNLEDFVVTARVLSGEHLLGGFQARLSNGETVTVEDAADAKELGKFAGTSHVLRFICTRSEDAQLRLKTFAITY